MDGFVSRHAGWEPREVTTQPFTFDGDALWLNFATSAAGSIRIMVTDAAGAVLDGYQSDAVFSDSIDRQIDCPSALSELAGRPVRLRVVLQDADVYSYRFGRVPSPA